MKSEKQRDSYTLKKLMLTLMLALIGTNAMAEWTAVDKTDYMVVYVDFATIRRTGDIVTMWSLNNFKTIQTGTSGKFLSASTEDEYDCKKEQNRLLAQSEYSGSMQGGTVVFDDSEPGGWKPITPNSVREALWKVACGKK